MKIQSKIVGMQGILLFTALLSLGLSCVFLYNSINPLLNKLDDSINMLSKANALEMFASDIIRSQKDLRSMTEHYIDTPHELAETKYDFLFRKTHEMINNALKEEEHGTTLLNISAVKTNIETIERKIILLTQEGKTEEAKALFASIEYKVLHDNFDAFVDQFSFTNKAQAEDSFSALVALTSSIKSNRQQLRQFMIVVILSIIVIFSISFIVSYAVSLSISRPLSKLTKGTRRISKGDLHYKMNIKSNDEIGQLAAAFNVMTGKLQELHGDLDTKVQKRTRSLKETQKKLKTKMAELEQMNEYIVGREEKIIELKNELKELKGKAT